MESLHNSRSAIPTSRSLKEEVGELYSAHAHNLFLYARTFTADLQTARDAVQETFLRYVVHRSDGNEVLHSKAWLYKVARNFLLDRGKEYYSRNRGSLEEVSNWSDQRQNPEKILQEKENYQQIIKDLSDRELECVRLRGQGFDYREIAELMEIRMGTVGALLARAARKIKNRSKTGGGRD
jgi:RNA polymerase sigma-70 factor, ECF subfamily